MLTSREIEHVLLAADSDIRIQDYFHVSLSPFSVLRDALRSRCHAFDLLSLNRTVFKIAASSRPEQTFSLFGTSWATGIPFLSNTSETRW